jgi:hypothetical protein
MLFNETVLTCDTRIQVWKFRDWICICRRQISKSLLMKQMSLLEERLLGFKIKRFIALNLIIHILYFQKWNVRFLSFWSHANLHIKSSWITKLCKSHFPLVPHSPCSFFCWGEIMSLELWLLRGPLSILQTVHMWIWSISGMILTVGNQRKSLFQCHFFSQTHMDFLDTNPGLCSEKLVTPHLCYGTAVTFLTNCC